MKKRKLFNLNQFYKCSTSKHFDKSLFIEKSNNIHNFVKIKFALK